MNKYRNKKIERHGITFDSLKEYMRYQDLMLLQRAGKITDLQRQVKFTLIPTQYEKFPRYSEKTGKRLKDGIRTLEKECSYIADFVYNVDGKQVVEDAKGFRTPEYRLKKKMMLYFHNIKIKEV